MTDTLHSAIPAEDQEQMCAEMLHQERMGAGMGRFSRDKQQIDEYQKHVLREIQTEPTDWHPEVVALGDTIRTDAFTRMYVKRMLEEVEEQYRNFTTIEMMLKAINYVVGTAPIYKDVSSIAWQFPLSALMNFWMMTPSGRIVLRMRAMNDHMNRIMKAWCVFLDSADSLYVLNEGPDGWLNPDAYRYNNVGEYIIPDRDAPHWGWESYNAFFHRDIKPEARPVDGQGDARIIVSPNDGVAWALQHDVKVQDQFWLKSQAYSLVDMLNDSPFTERFVGGTVYQTYVNGAADWHRFTAPIEGTVIGAEVVTGYAWTESDVIRYDPMSGPYSQGWAAGVATRALIFIESKSPILGTVCVIPIGLTEVSSVELFVQEGDTVKKGDQMGWFSFGGSSFAMAFQPGALQEILVKPPATGRNNQPTQTLWANRRFAIAAVE